MRSQLVALICSFTVALLTACSGETRVTHTAAGGDITATGDGTVTPDAGPESDAVMGTDAKPTSDVAPVSDVAPAPDDSSEPDVAVDPDVAPEPDTSAECPEPFAGPECDECADEKFTGPNCDACADETFTGANCDECVDERFTGPACDECADEAFTGPDCDECVDPLFTGPGCDECVDATFTGPACDECADPHFVGPDCTECAELFTGPDCDECANPLLTGSACDECVDPHFVGPDCAECAEQFIGENCDECADPTFTGVNCTECADPSFAGPNCTECANPLYDDAECVGAFRQVAPMSTARSTSNRPTFRVALPGALDGALITVCEEVSCETVIMTFEVGESGGSPTTPLPAGPVYWYAEGLTDGAVSDGPTPTWQLHIPAFPAPHGTTWGTTFDLELDGLADVLVAACGLSGCTEMVGLHRGGSAGPSPVPASTLVDPNLSPYFGFSVSSAGDVNGDGLPDVIVGGGLGDSAHVFLNSPDGMMTDPVQSWFVGGSFFGFSVAAAGDVNGDGYGDVVVGSMLGFSAFVYYGGPEGPGSGPNKSLSTGALGFGVSVSSAGDVNGDGYEDMLIGAANGIPPEVSLWYGGPDGPPPVASMTLTGEGTFGISARSAGDINGDGYADIVVGTGGMFLAYHGGPDGVGPDPALFDSGVEGFGISVAGAGDVNGDGYGDVVIGGGTRASIYMGAAGGLAPDPIITLMGAPSSQFGDSVACLGDTNGDGYDDVGVGATNENRAYAYLGGEAGVTEEAVIEMSMGPSDEEVPPEGYGFSVGNSIR